MREESRRAGLKEKFFVLSPMLGTCVENLSLSCACVCVGGAGSRKSSTSHLILFLAAKLVFGLKFRACLLVGSSSLLSLSSVPRAVMSGSTTRTS